MNALPLEVLSTLLFTRMSWICWRLEAVLRRSRIFWGSRVAKHHKLEMEVSHGRDKCLTVCTIRVTLEGDNILGQDPLKSLLC